MRSLIFLAIGCASLIAQACDQPTPPHANPRWVSELIARYQAEPVGNPPQSIWRYQYRGQTVYYIPPQCCDQYSQLFDAKGGLLCAPDGGLSGSGDGRCPEFFKERTEEQLIWQDPRKP